MWVDADGGERDTLFVDGGPAFHEVSRNLHWGDVVGSGDAVRGVYAHLDEPHSPVPRIHHEWFVRVWLVILLVSPVDGIELLGVLLLHHRRVFHFDVYALQIEVQGMEGRKGAGIAGGGVKSS